MKKVILLLASVLVGLSAYAQGTLDFNNRNIGGVSGANAPVYSGAVDTGTLLDQTAFVQIFAGPVGGPLVAQGVPTNFRTSPANGYVSGGTVTLDKLDFGTTVQVQLRAWNAAAGTTWAAASVNYANGAATGVSAPITITLPAASAPPPLPTPLTGLAKFAISQTINPIPEPTTIALGLLGAALLLIRRRQ